MSIIRSSRLWCWLPHWSFRSWFAVGWRWGAVRLEWCPGCSYNLDPYVALMIMLWSSVVPKAVKLVWNSSPPPSSFSSYSYNPSIFWSVGSFPSGIVAIHSFYCCTTVSCCVSGDLLLSIAVEVFPWPFFRILLLQGCLQQTRYAQLCALSMSGVYFFLK